MRFEWRWLALAVLSAPAPVQAPRDDVWLAGRLDRDRVVIYFDTVKFGAHIPATTVALPAPTAREFLMPRVVPALTINALHRPAGAHQFAIGDRYDLLLGSGRVVIVTLSAAVVYVGDEATGNTSYIGALAKVMPADVSRLFGNYFVARRHVEGTTATTTVPPGRNAHASLSSMPSYPQIEARIAPLLNKRFAADTDAAVRRALVDGKITFTGVQTFYVANGGVRYFARVKLESATLCVNMEAWVTQYPEFAITAADEMPCRIPSLPLLNVLELGPGRTLAIAAFVGEDSGSLRLLEYRDDAGFGRMRVLQSIWHAE